MFTYFLGICGTAMGNAALLTQAAGHHVEGADSGIYPPMSEVLRKANITVHDGYCAERIEQLKPDRVVVGNALSRGNPEIEWLLRERSIEMVSLPELLGREILKQRLPVVITGTHGKTTTATLTAHLLQSAHAEPGWLIGGVPINLSSGAQLGNGAPFVIEGDEYDSAFFDKRSKFIHYRPRIAVINNLEFDHADIFRDLADVQRTFSHFLKLLPADGLVLINGDDANINALLPVPWTQLIRVGMGDENDLRIYGFEQDAKGSSFDLLWRGQHWGRCQWQLHGSFNARNAAMAILAAACAQNPMTITAHALPGPFPAGALAEFKGVRRRQDTLHHSRTITLIEDFGHHPTAIEEMLKSLRLSNPEHHLLACFEPRSNSARGKIFAAAFTTALAHADSVLLAPVHRADALTDNQRLDTVSMANALSAQGIATTAFSEPEALYQKLLDSAQHATAGQPLLIVCFTNGSLYGIPSRLSTSFNTTHGIL
jgi:UDP-N-acetylmuramate: L-alanyl-gamma-D-glutamyl-meso-diaminopimelate ligase